MENDEKKPEAELAAPASLSINNGGFAVHLGSIDGEYIEPETIVINQKYKNYFGEYALEARTALHENLRVNGVRDSIKVIRVKIDGAWVYAIIDGHTRFELCQEIGIECYICVVDPAPQTEEEILKWIRSFQRSRRNMTKAQFDYCVGKENDDSKKNAADNLKRDGTSPNGQNDRLVETTAQRIGEQYGISESSVRRRTVFANQVDEIEKAHGVGAKTAILAGKAKIGDYKPKPTTPVAKKPVAKSTKVKGVGGKASKPIEDDELPDEHDDNHDGDAIDSGDMVDERDTSASMIQSFADIAETLKAMLDGKPPTESANVLSAMAKVEGLVKRVRKFVETA